MEFRIPPTDPHATRFNGKAICPAWFFRTTDYWDDRNATNLARNTPFLGEFVGTGNHPEVEPLCDRIRGTIEELRK